MVDNLNNVYGVHRQNYGELKNTRSDTSITFSPIWLETVQQERSNANG